MLKSGRRFVFACVVGLAAPAVGAASDVSKERLERLMTEHGAIRRQLAEAFPTSGVEMAAVVLDVGVQARKDVGMLPDESPSPSPAPRPPRRIDWGLVFMGVVVGYALMLLLAVRNFDP